LPGAARGGKTIARPAQLADVFPTILALTGIEESNRSLLLDVPARPIYSETLYPRIHLGWSDLRSLIDGRFHYIDGPRPELYDLVRDAEETRDEVSQDRRTAASMRATLAPFATAIAQLQNVNAEEAAKLAALGYVGAPRTRSGPLPNPRDEISHLADLKAA